MKIEVIALPQAASVDIKALVHELSLMIAAELGEEGSFTKWVIWRTVDPGCYSDGRLEPDTQLPDTHPPYVTIFAYDGHDRARHRERVMTRVGEFLSSKLGLAPGNVAVNWFDISKGYAYYRHIIGTSDVIGASREA